MKYINKILAQYYYKKFLQAPPVLRIETTNLCNARCITCPRNLMTRKTGIMNIDLFKKIIDEAKTLNISRTHLHNYGEPLLDNTLFEKIVYAKNAGMNVKIFTNASLITKEKAKSLIETKIDEIKISMDGVKKETFEKIRKNLQFQKVIEGIENILSAKKKANAKTKISLVLVYIEENKKEAKLLKQKWKDKVDSIIITQYHNWAEESAVQKKSLTHQIQSKILCSRLWRTMTILWDGKVSLCCIDYNGEIILGDLNSQSIKEVWTNKTYENIRNLHINCLQDKIPLCKTCTIGRL